MERDHEAGPERKKQRIQGKEGEGSQTVERSPREGSRKNEAEEAGRHQPGKEVGRQEGREEGHTQAERRLPGMQE